MSQWSDNAVFYHIYPLGLCGAPQRNDFSSPPVDRLSVLHSWLSHIKGLGANAIYLGPLFESSSHGYDTADYGRVDRRLGTNESLAGLCSAAHAMGIRVVLDGVFNHVGRDFWAFKDVAANRESSRFTSWFHGLAFGKKSPYGDPFSYEGWNGHFSLVKLNLTNPDVREHIFSVVASWVREFDIDGLRLDAADVMDMDFLKVFSAQCRRLRPDFWLLGEVVHGDYRKWANPQTLDSVTNYECYKGLYSSHADRNYFEIAWSLDRQFGPAGLYRGLPLYAFADNHDVDRVASMVKEPRHLYTLYCLLFTMPGVPSVYYGSEWGIEGKKDGSDWPLRPRLDLAELARSAPHADLAQAIRRFAGIRQSCTPLRFGDYTQLAVSHEQLAFARRHAGLTVVVVVNASRTAASVPLEIPGVTEGRLVDVLNAGVEFPVKGGKANIDPVPSGWARIMEAREG
jgi:cyclomaltodextrinase / maltogenic alpha-amylase / neopullulanase